MQNLFENPLHRSNVASKPVNKSKRYSHLDSNKENINSKRLIRMDEA